MTRRSHVPRRYGVRETEGHHCIMDRIIRGDRKVLYN
jgi:hypothetical protein